MSFYNSDGSWNVTVVSNANSLYAADGSLNVKLSPGASNTHGLYNPTGGMYVTYTTSAVNSRHAADGSLYVTTNNSSGAQRVHVNAGSLTGAATARWPFFFV